jgi:hypothetical protein
MRVPSFDGCRPMRLNWIVEFAGNSSRQTPADRWTELEKEIGKPLLFWWRSSSEWATEGLFIGRLPAILTFQQNRAGGCEPLVHRIDVGLPSI